MLAVLLTIQLVVLKSHLQENNERRRQICDAMTIYTPVLVVNNQIVELPHRASGLRGVGS